MLPVWITYDASTVVTCNSWRGTVWDSVDLAAECVSCPDRQRVRRRYECCSTPASATGSRKSRTNYVLDRPVDIEDTSPKQQHINLRMFVCYVPIYLIA